MHVAMSTPGLRRGHLSHAERNALDQNLHTHSNMCATFVRFLIQSVRTLCSADCLPQTCQKIPRSLPVVELVSFD